LRRDLTKIFFDFIIDPLLFRVFKMLKWIVALSLAIGGVWGDNQTPDVSPILSGNLLPFEVIISLANFQLPSDDVNGFGIQDFAWAVHDGKWLLIAGRTNGMHGFSPGDHDFPPEEQNTVVYVVDPNNHTVVTKSLTDSTSQLSSAQIDTLSVTSPQYYQVDNTLYVLGGYGIESATGLFTTKSTVTAIDVPKMIKWVEKGSSSAAKCIRQNSHPLIQVAGGFLTQTSGHQSFLLAFGQNFNAASTIGMEGVYTQQIRPFRIIDNGTDLYIKPDIQYASNPSYRRTGVNVLPIMQKTATSLIPAVVGLSGGFTTTLGIWTVPVQINGNGSSSMADPANANTFKQGMNNYDCARFGLYSKSTNEMYMLLCGGISYITVDGGVFMPNIELPFINNVTTVKIDAQGNFQQYLMGAEYPTILSEFSNPGNTLLFGTEARFIPATNLPTFPNGVFSFDALGSSPVLLGYIVGGIQSSVPNTSGPSDSAASPYIFSVYAQRR
jgi:hypothetical protein